MKNRKKETKSQENTRNSNIDILRAVAILLVIIYHVYALTGVYLNIPLIRPIIWFGGEVGVTIFLIISGFSIYLSLDKVEGKISYKEFLKKRALRILPEYYFCIIVSLFCMGSVIYLSKRNLFDIISHLLLIHNLFPKTHGSINGSLWTIGVIFQFYLLAKVFYRWIKKHKYETVILSMIIVIVSKTFIYRGLDMIGREDLFFVYGRQLLTTCDCFLLGMFLADAMKNHSRFLDKKILNLVLGLIFFYFAMYLAKKYTVYINTIVGYTWHTILAIGLTLLIAFFCRVNFKNNFIVKTFLFLSKYEYGIYLWNLIIIENFLTNSMTMKSLLAGPYRLLGGFFLFLIPVLIGLFLSIIFNNSYSYWKLSKKTN